MRKRVLPLMLTVLALVMCLALAASAAEVSYSDKKWENGRYDATLANMAGRRLYVYGIVDSENEVGTDADIELRTEEMPTRLEIANMLYRICGDGAETSPSPFTDVPEEYIPAVNWLYSVGVTKGISKTQFGVSDLTEYQLFVMLSRLLGWQTENETEIYSLAGEAGLLPEGDFSRGKLFLTLCNLLDKYYSDAKMAKRPQISVPYTVTVTASSYEDAQAKIKTALEYAPTRVTVRFTDNCPDDERDALYEFYLIGEINRTKPLSDDEIPLIYCFKPEYDGCYGLDYERKPEYDRAALIESRSAIDARVANGEISPAEGIYNKEFLDYELRGTKAAFTIKIYKYADAFAAYADSSDWLRYFEEEAYCGAVADFVEKYIEPVKRAGLSENQRALEATVIVRKLASYDYDEYRDIINAGYSTHPNSHNIIGFLTDHKIVCDGYSTVYQWILLYLDIPCFKVIGDTSGGAHAWNKVRIDGTWYNVDVTWMESSGRYYFLKSDDFFAANGHKFADEALLRCFASELSYISSTH